MSKIISVWGSPNSGKTSLSVKLAELLYSRFHAVVGVVCADMTAPALPVLFPNKKADEMFSLGEVLSKPEVTLHDVLNNVVTVRGKTNMGFLGLKDGENRFSYPSFDDVKAEALFSILKGLAEFLVVDCTSDIQNTLTASAIKRSDHIIRIVNPDLKSLSFFSSQLPLLGDPKYRRDEHLICLNENEYKLFMPVQEAISHYGEVAFSFPYCPQLKTQYARGNLTDKVIDHHFDTVLSALAKRVV
ncbi:MAG: hypothetical protein ABF449_02615 [Ethanoligenens sp.]